MDMPEGISPETDCSPKESAGKFPVNPVNKEGNSATNFRNLEIEYRRLSVREKQNVIDPDEKTRLSEVEGKIDDFVNEYRGMGGLFNVDRKIEDLQRRFEILVEVGKRGELKHEQVSLFLGDLGSGQDGDWEELDVSGDKYMGVANFELRRRLEEIANDVSDLSPQSERLLDTEEEYEFFLKDIRWANSHKELIDESNPPAFWVTLSERDKMLTKTEIELANAVHYKRDEGYNLEKASMNNEFSGFTKSETAEIYKILGVRGAMELYVKLTKDGETKFERKVPDGKSRVFTFRECGDKKDSLVVRDYVKDKIKDELKKTGLSGKQLETAALRAETDALNLLYLGNFFESMDSEWEIKGNGEKEKEVSIPLKEGTFTHPLLAGAMKPLESMVVSYSKESAKLVPIGSLGLWGCEQSRNALRRSGVKFDEKNETDNDKFSLILVTVPYEQNNPANAEKLWWTAKYDKQNKKVRMYIPECYPTKLLGNIFEETEIKDRNGKDKHTLFWYLENEKEIPWEQSGAGNMWIAYKVEMMSADSEWKFYDGKNEETKILPGKFGGVDGAFGYLSSWLTSLEVAMAGLSKRTDINRLRWHVYASVGVNPEKKNPELAIHPQSKWVLSDVFSTGGGYCLNQFKGDGVLFNWDKVSKMRKLFA